jgi:phage host-nuclease inhibitor protein Gam
MRERNARKKREEDLVQLEIAASVDSPEVLRLKRQISALITENNRLRQQKNDRRAASWAKRALQ